MAEQQLEALAIHGKSGRGPGFLGLAEAEMSEAQKVTGPEPGRGTSMRELAADRLLQLCSHSSSFKVCVRRLVVVVVVVVNRSSRQKKKL